MTEREEILGLTELQSFYCKLAKQFMVKILKLELNRAQVASVDTHHAMENIRKHFRLQSFPGLVRGVLKVHDS